MTLRVSTATRNKMLGLIGTPIAVANNDLMGGTVAYVDGGAGSDTITTTAGSFITEGFAPGQTMYTYSSTTGANDLTGTAITGVAAQTITFATGVVDTAENFAATTFLVACKGGSLKDIFKDGIIRIYSGTQPATADTAYSGTLLVEITVSAGAWAAGAFDNGLEFGTAASGVIAKSSTETWQGTAVATGTAGWFRLYANATDAGGASTTLPRIDGSCGTSGADLNMSSTSITSGSTYTIDTFQFTYPAYYGA